MSTPTNVLNAGTGVTTALTVSSATYTVGAGNNQRLVVGLHLWAQSVTLPSAITCTHNGVAMTQRRLSQSNNTNGGASTGDTLVVFDLVLGSTTPSGVIVASWGSRSSYPLMTAFTVAGVDQSATPANTASQSLGPDSLATTSTYTVIDFICNDSQNLTTGFAVTAGAGQTALANTRVAAGTATEGNFASSYANTPGASTTSMSWTGNVSLGPRAAHIMVGYAAVSSGLNAAVISAEALDTSAASATTLSSAAVVTAERLDTTIAAANTVVTALVATAETGDTTSASASVGAVVSASIASIESADTSVATATISATAAVASMEASDTTTASAATSASSAIASIETADSTAALASASTSAAVSTIERGDTTAATASIGVVVITATVVSIEDADATAAAAGIQSLLIVDTHDGATKRRHKEWAKQNRDRDDLRAQLARAFRPSLVEVAKVTKGQKLPETVSAPIAALELPASIRAPLMRPVLMPFANGDAIRAADEEDIEMLLLEMA